MKRETILKTMLILIIGAILFAMPVNVFAEAADLDVYFENQGSLQDIGGDTQTETQTTTTPTTTTQPETTTTPSTGTTTGTTTQESTYSDAGLAEDTLMVVTIGGLVVAAIFAYRKVNEYQNI